MPDIEYYEDEIRDLEKDINKTLLAIRKKVLEADEKLKKLKKANKKYAAAIKDHPDKGNYSDAKKEHKNEYRKLETHLEDMKSEISRNTLMGGDEPPKEEKKEKKKKGSEVREVTTNPRTGKVKVKDKELEDELFKEIYEMQGESLKIVQRLIAKADDTIDVAQESAEMLKKQREQLVRIDEKMDELGSNITRGRKEIVSFMRKLATDKVIMLIIILIVLGIIGLIIWRIVVAVLPKSTPAPTTPATPTPT
ncbi:hypothetical protein AKO1_011061 [Acrasis kona]|uniref:t-SNARE coiled-coil homology domain-containing protein n=1 Tax=Acrasis kona TaxID=1008807 RepID=A0AAW2YSL4_9EUKA